ncbi:MAG TPA: ABC transporter permease, partial [Polyangiaceae bacterium]|nr:ABC transporter permease [Polyangiaceae bacterium]
MRRLGARLAVVWAVVSIAFAVNELLPGDPARAVAGVQARPADVARIRQQLGLDRPPAVRYVLFWRRLVHVGPRLRQSLTESSHASCAVLLPLGRRALHVDFGMSFQRRTPVVDLLAERLPRTFVLALAGVFAQLLFGITTGTLAATRRGSWLDRAFVTTSLLGISAPTFLIALLLQLVLARELGWLPLDGYGTTFAEHASCLVLPALTLGIYGAAYYTRLVRDEMNVLLRSDWIRTARAKGVRPWAVVAIHALRS